MAVLPEAIVLAAIVRMRPWCDAEIAATACVLQGEPVAAGYGRASRRIGSPSRAPNDRQVFVIKTLLLPMFR